MIPILLQPDGIRKPTNGQSYGLTPLISWSRGAVFPSCEFCMAPELNSCGQKGKIKINSNSWKKLCRTVRLNNNVRPLDAHETYPCIFIHYRDGGILLLRRERYAAEGLLASIA